MNMRILWNYLALAAILILTAANQSTKAVKTHQQISNEDGECLDLDTIHSQYDNGYLKGYNQAEKDFRTNGFDDTNKLKGDIGVGFDDGYRAGYDDAKRGVIQLVC